MHDSSGRKVRVYLIDDHPIVREGFARGLADAPDIIVVGQADTAAEALHAGAHGYLVKTSKMEEVIDGLRRIAAGGAALSPKITGAVLRAMRKRSGQPSGALDALTTRERQVLRLLAMGISTREAAARLTISPKTIETHRVRIYSKLGCKSAVELTRIAVRTGMIEA